MERAKEKLTFVLPLTLAIILILLYLNFRSFSEVAIIVVTLPMAMIGGLWLMYLEGFNFSVAVGVGFIDNQSSYEKYNTYFGVRISALMSSDESNDNIYLLAPLLGAEYYFSERFSLGGEGRLNYAFDNSKEENRIIEFSTHLFFRFYK